MTDKQSITIDLTPISGDPDMVLAISDLIEYPTSTQHDLSSADNGFDSFRVSYELFQSKNPKCLEKGFNGLCSIMVGVFTKVSEHSIFTLLASVEDTDNQKYKYLSDGIPQYGKIEAGSLTYTYYAFKASSMNPIYISVKDFTNDLDVYVNYVTSNIPQDEWEYPSQNKAMFFSEEHSGIELIYLSKERLADCGISCTILIGIVVNPYLSNKNLESSYYISVYKGI
jgi:hypothetical protein